MFLNRIYLAETERNPLVDNTTLKEKNTNEFLSKCLASIECNFDDGCDEYYEMINKLIKEQIPDVERQFNFSFRKKEDEGYNHLKDNIDC